MRFFTTATALAAFATSVMGAAISVNNNVIEEAASLEKRTCNNPDNSDWFKGMQYQDNNEPKASAATLQALGECIAGKKYRGCDPTCCPFNAASWTEGMYCVQWEVDGWMASICNSWGGVISTNIDDLAYAVAIAEPGHSTYYNNKHTESVYGLGLAIEACEKYLGNCQQEGTLYEIITC